MKSSVNSKQLYVLSAKMFTKIIRASPSEENGIYCSFNCVVESVAYTELGAWRLATSRYMQTLTFLQPKSLGHCPRCTIFLGQVTHMQGIESFAIRALVNLHVKRQVQGTDTSSCQMWKPSIYCSISSIRVNTEISFEYITWDEFVVW